MLLHAHIFKLAKALYLEHDVLCESSGRSVVQDRRWLHGVDESRRSNTNTAVRLTVRVPRDNHLHTSIITINAQQQVFFNIY